MSIKNKLQNQETIIGVISNIASPAVAEILALSGFDFVMMDMEHGPLNFETLENCVRAIIMGGSVPFVRVTDNHPKLILRALDAGAMGLMVPQVNGAEEARDAVVAMKYAPKGVRGLALSTFAGRYGSSKLGNHLKKANNEVLLIAQIETLQAYKNLDSIIKVSDLDVIIIGSSDLSQSMGYPGQLNHPEVQAKVQDIINYCVNSNKWVGTVANTPEQVSWLHKMGARVILSGVSGLLMKAGKDYISDANNIIMRNKDGLTR